MREKILGTQMNAEKANADGRRWKMRVAVPFADRLKIPRP
jgi:hypothetical protein